MAKPFFEYRWASRRHISDSRYIPSKHISKYEELFHEQVKPLGRMPSHLIGDEIQTIYLKHLAQCQVWTGKEDADGFGYLHVHGRKMQIQGYAFELYFAPVPVYDLANFGEVPQYLVPRCVVAATKNCVHRDHIGIVHANSNYWRPTELETRSLIRRHAHADRSYQGNDFLSPAELALKFRMPEARVARILLGIEGSDDNGQIYTIQPVDKDP